MLGRETGALGAAVLKPGGKFMQVFTGTQHRAGLDTVAFGKWTLRNTNCSLKVWFAVVSPKKEKGLSILLN